MPPPESLNPNRWLEDHGDYLFAFALQRVRNPSIAEDLVQDALLGALKGADRFEGASTERTWLTAILKNKIHSHYRKAGREITETDLRLPGDEDSGEFEPNGHIIESRGARTWGSDPRAAAERADFQAALRACLDNIPERAAEIFLSREVDGESTDEIASRHGISKNNLWVLLHRARRLLRSCLEINYFEKQARV